MPELSRRHFLQAAGATLATVGLHQSQLLRHQKVLAQPTRRKLALIIGINDYADVPLYGCVNDAILQRHHPDLTHVNPHGEGLTGTLVPVDGTLPDDAESRGGVVADIMGHTLFLVNCHREEYGVG